ncbi:MAG: DUF952 domain-containing protein [Ilumatobacteraceae bacterium]|nr:DUF952 domain-containing protein [Ilumatobacteraceae bacterium]
MSGEVAVIFSSVRRRFDDDGYAAAAEQMERLAAQQPGFLGVESARNPDGSGITVSYWLTADHARAWGAVAEHRMIQALGRQRWYESYRLRVAEVVRSHDWHVELPDRITHVALPRDWADAQARGEYRWSTRGVTLEQEGFIHCSLPHQVAGVIERFYDGVDELVLLEIDTSRLAAPVVLEPPAPGVAEHFPHVYGPIPVTAVVATTPWRR